MAAAAYQSGEKLHSDFTGTWEYGKELERIVHTEIMLPPNAPREYADRQTLWNAVDAAEKGQNAQTARRLIIALPKELTMEQNIELIRHYCQTTFVDKGMIADIAIHFNHEDPPNPHAHILLTMRAMDEQGKWLPKSKNTYALDENGNRIIGKSGKPKRFKVDTVDWNNQENCERWRHEWEVQQNIALEEAGRSERIDMRSYKRQGIEIAPQQHLGPAASALEKKGIRTELGNHNNAVQLIGSIFRAIGRKVKALSDWLKEAATTISAHEKITNPYEYPLVDVLMAYCDRRAQEREGWHHNAQTKYHLKDLSEVLISCSWLRNHGIDTIHDFSTALNETSTMVADLRGQVREKEQRIRDIDAIIDAVKTLRDLHPVLDKYNSIHFKKSRDKYYQQHKEEIDKIKKAQWLLNKLKVQLPIDGKALRKEAKQLRNEVEALLPQLERTKADMDRMSKIRSHIRKVMPDALAARYEDGRRSFADFEEEQANQQELDGLLQGTAEHIIQSSPAHDDTRQTEPRRQIKDKGDRRQDETR